MIWQVILSSAIGTIVGVLIVFAFWMFCDWWFDARATETEN